jgi:hypothetical protein
MKGSHKEHHHGKHHKKAGGGRIGNWSEGDPVVEKEAEGKEDYAKGDEKKHGGKVKHHGKHRAAGGKVESKDIGRMAGGAVRPRLDRPGRKRGGAVGSDRSPLSTAHSGHKDGHEMPNSKDTYGGTPP